MALLAFAKVNLALEVLGRRPDGYHEVRTVLQTIDLADRLAVRPADTLQVQCDDPALEGEANIVWQAAVALAERKGVRPRAHISIEKNIPVGMGFGGGSSVLEIERVLIELPRHDLGESAVGALADEG